MLVLFAGVAALLKYAADRLAATCRSNCGWPASRWPRWPRWRSAGANASRKRAFALVCKAARIGILLLTVFAAFRLYQLLPADSAFGLLLVIVAGTGVLAVLQDALALAVLAIVAGLLAPILAVDRQRQSRRAVLATTPCSTSAIFAIAWLRPWRALNLLGFVFTFVIGTAWGVLSYEPRTVRETEPFLMLFFAFYLAIPMLYARKQRAERRDLVDGSLVFGNPLVAFALQAALLDGERMPLAYSALRARASSTRCCAWMLRAPRRHARARRIIRGARGRIRDAGRAAGACPRARPAATLALEGAALVWLGLRQQRRLPRWSGLALQLLAAGAFLAGICIRRGALRRDADRERRLHQRRC